MTIRELHGIAPASGAGRYVQTIQVIDGDGTVIVAMTEASPATITADEARYLADMLLEAADRVAPREEDIAKCNEIVDRLEAARAEREVPEAEPIDPLPSLIAVRNPKPPSPWTPERNAMMRREVPLGRLTREELFAALNALEGTPIQNPGRLGSQAHSLGLKWGTPPEPAPAAPETAQEPDQVATPEPAYLQEFGRADSAPGVAAVRADYTAPIRQAFTNDRQVPPGLKAMDYEQVRDLAARWGVNFSSWDDLPSVNNKAERLGHPRIERRYVVPRKLHNLDAD